MKQAPRLRSRLLAMMLVVTLPGWAIVVATYLPLLLDSQLPATALLAVLALAAVSIAAIIWVITYAWTRFVVSPIMALEQGAHALASGEMETRVTSQQLPIELHGTAEAFDRMADEVQRTRLSLERRMLERTMELRERNKQLVDATRYKSEFLANMSHEIRTPLNAVIGMANVLADMDLPAEQRGAVETIRVSGQHLLTVISDILDISRIEAGRMDLEETPISIRDVVEESVAVAGTQAHRKKVELALDFSDDVPPGMLGDAGRLRQIIVNLVGNAVKFTDKGQILVRVQYLGGDLRVEVEDTGVGIASKSVPELFTSFHQLDVRGNRRFGGTGLGLAISSRLVDMMGGEIGYRPTGGGGSTFWFKIPCKTAAPPSAVPWSHTDGLEGHRVLVVDDHVPTLNILRHQLETWQLDVTAFDDPLRAFRSLKDLDPFDLIILDVRMPNMSGTAFARDLPERFKAPIILVGPDPSTGDDMSLAHAVLAKPPRSTELFYAISQALGADAGVERPHRFDKDLANRQPLNIMVVEDSPVNQRVAKALLARFGYETDIANGGLEAIHKAVATNYDLILMDIEMPDLDGNATARQLIGSGNRAYISAMTAHVSPEDRRKCRDAGMAGYLAKPVSVAALAEVLHAAWTKKSQLRAPHVEDPALAET